jgi:aminopeptidase N
VLTDIIQQDSTDQTREVSADVTTSDEINQNLNPTITYGKGASIVNMLTYVLGEETFKKGLTSYFTKFNQSNVDQYDLWNSLYKVSFKSRRHFLLYILLISVLIL